MYFKTYFNYDSFNRITKIKYPDDEIVSYHYDKGGNLKSVNNNYGETYIQDIKYNGLEQREGIQYGNGTSQYYSYNPQNIRLERYYLYNASNNLMLNNTYQYDAFENITQIKNEAYPLANGMGGVYQSYFGYDTLNRLIGTGSEKEILDGENQPIQSTFIAPTTYQLKMKYNNTGGIVQKRQHHERDQNVVPENTYDNDYGYIGGSHRLEKVADTSSGAVEYFEYDLNGNTIGHTDMNGTKQMFWDEQERLRAFYNDNSGVYQYYTYDDKGERTIKYGLEAPSQLYQNGVPIKIDELKLFEYKLYPNPYVTVSSTGQYTKHYFEGSTRFASRLKDGAVRFEDPAVLYTNREAGDKAPEKTADVKSDFEKYLEKSGFGNEVSVELREKHWSPDLYYLHGDHLGTATFVTNSQAEATQFFLNLPFGETMLEQTDGSYDNPFKFNAKELDDDTGLYYYGARYYNPRLSIWYGVDPLAEVTPSWSPYAYALQNPIRYVDPTGMIAVDCPKCPKPSYEGQTMTGADGKNYGAARQQGDTAWDVPTKPLEWLGQTDIEGVTITGQAKSSNSSSISSYQSVGNFRGPEPGGGSLSYDIPILTVPYMLLEAVATDGLIKGGMDSDNAQTTASAATFLFTLRPSSGGGGFNPVNGFKNAISPFKGGGLTNAGRAVTKHPEYFGFESTEALMSVYRSSGALNKLGSTTLKNILRNGTAKTGAGGRYPNGWTTYTLPNGNAASWGLDGTFIGFRGIK